MKGVVSPYKRALQSSSKAVCSTGQAKSSLLGSLSIKPSQSRLFLLSRLLPYGLESRAGKMLDQGLQEYLFLLSIVEQAMNAILNGTLKDFDPLVGENACQIRAVKLAFILSGKEHDPELILENVLYAKKVIFSFIERGVKCSQRRSLKSFLDLEKIDIGLNYSELFLVKSHLLTKGKVSRSSQGKVCLLNREFTDIKKIQKMGNISRTFVENLLNNLRPVVAKYSLQFIDSISREMSFLGKGSIDSLDDISVTHNGLQCLPCYWTMNVIVKKISDSRIPIVLLVDQTKKDADYCVEDKRIVAFYPSSNGCQEVDISILQPDMPAIVFHGSSCTDFRSLDEWKADFLKNCPLDLILACAAAHPQYPGDLQGNLPGKIMEDRYTYYLEKAQEWGCSTENPSRFFLTHVFCDRIDNIESY